MSRDEYFDIEQIKQIKQEQMVMAKRCLKTINAIYTVSRPCNISDCREFLEIYCYASKVIKDLYEYSIINTESERSDHHE